MIPPERNPTAACRPPEPRPGEGRPWWEAAFGEDYLDVYAHRDDASAIREVAFATDVLALPLGARVLDAGCGAGRHVRALAAQGLRVVGLDRSLPLLRRATRYGRPARYVAADLRALPFPAGVFDAVVSFFTSFGYFDDAGDRRHLAELRRVLRPGGALLLDYLNAPHLIRCLVPSSTRQAGVRELREERSIRNGRVEKRVEVRREGQVEASWTESVRLYDARELRALLADAGFSTVAVYAGLAGGAWSTSSERLVVRALAR